MKRALLTLAFLLWSWLAYTCHLSSLSINSITDNGSSFSIELTLAIGGGILGATQGADNFTGTIALGAYGDGITPLNLLSYPATISSDTTGCTMNSSMFTGAFGADVGVGYIAPGCQFACISSTALCGTPHSQLVVITLEFNVLPQSIQAFGLEGAGNPVAGCYGEADTIVYPALFLPVEWGDVAAESISEGANAIRWNTLSESNTSHFVVQSSLDGHYFGAVETLEAAGYSFTPQYYEVIDRMTSSSTMYYRILQVDQDGTTSLSPMVAVEPLEHSTFDPQVFPNPGTEQITISNAKGSRMFVQDLSGNEVLSATAISERFFIPTAELARGLYILRFMKEDEVRSVKWVKR